MSRPSRMLLFHAWDAALSLVTQAPTTLETGAGPTILSP